MVKRKSSNLNTVVFLHLFFSVFYLVAIKTIVDGFNKNNTDALIVGFSFIAIPFLVHLISYKSISYQREKDKNIRKYRDTPWMIRKDWREKKSKSNNDNLIAFFVLITLGLIFIGLGYLILTGNEIKQINRSQPLIGKLIYLFPIGGFLSIIHAIKNLIAAKKFGTSYIRFPDEYIELGKELNANLFIKKNTSDGKVINYVLTCTSIEQTYSGKETRQFRKILWEQKWNSNITTQSQHMGHLVKVIIPKDLPESRALQRSRTSYRAEDTIVEKLKNSSKHGIEWALEVTIDLNGVDYINRFELPVFKGNSTHLSPHSLNNILEDKLKVTNGLEFIRIKSNAQSKSLNFSVSKGNKTAIYIFLFGLFFLAPGLLLLTISDYSNFDIFVVFKTFMGTVFTLAGSGIILASLITISFSIQLAINNNQFSYRRYHLFGRTLVNFNRSDFQSIKRKSSLSAGATKFFDIILYIDKFQKSKLNKLTLNIPSELEVKFVESVLLNINEIDKINR